MLTTIWIEHTSQRNTQLIYRDGLQDWNLTANPVSILFHNYLPSHYWRRSGERWGCFSRIQIAETPSISSIIWLKVKFFFWYLVLECDQFSGLSLLRIWSDRQFIGPGGHTSWTGRWSFRYRQAVHHQRHYHWPTGQDANIVGPRRRVHFSHSLRALKSHLCALRGYRKSLLQWRPLHGSISLST